MTNRDGEVSYTGVTVGGVCAVAFLFCAWDSYYTIDQGERGVVLHYGKVADESEPGLHFKIPFVTSIEKVSVQTQRDPFEQSKDGDHRMQPYTQDQQPTHVALSINYHVTNVSSVYSLFGSLGNMEQRIIDPRANEQVRNVFGGYNAIEAVQNRAKLNAQVYNALKDSLKGLPIMVESVQIEDIEFSPAYEQAVESRMQAIVAQQQALAEKQKRITNADAAAYEVKAQADASAHKVEVEGKAQADAIRERGDALKENPEMPQLVAAEKWDGHLPETMPPNSTVPFLSLDRKQ